MPEPGSEQPEQMRRAEPQGPIGQEAAPGAVTQDDPSPTDRTFVPDTGSEGQLTFVAVFEEITAAQSCAADLGRRALPIETAMVNRRGDGPEQGLQPGNIITGDGYGLSADDQAPPQDHAMGSGVLVGATIGATAGLLAATYLIPQFGPLVTTAPLLSTLTGAGIGSFLGGLAEHGAHDPADDATLYAGQVRRGGVLLLVRTSAADAERVRKLIEFWQPLELRVQ